MTNHADKSSSSLNEYNPWVIAVGSAPNRGYTMPVGAARDSKSRLRAGQNGLFGRLRSMLRWA